METTPTAAGGEPRRFDVDRILVPTDFSDCASRAFAYAVALAAEHHAEIRLLHVLAIYEPELYRTADDRPYAAELEQHMEAHVQEQLAAAAGADAGHGVPVEPVFRRSLATTPTILQEAASYGADLIVLGTHGRRGLGHLLLGSVAEEVVRRAPVSVLTVRGESPANTNHIQRILAPTDFSEHAAQAVQVAKELAQRYGAALDLLHVVEPIPFAASVSMGSQNVYDYVPELRQRIQDALERLASDGAMPASVHVEHGHAAHTITDFAGARGSDLIVMSTHGLSGLARFFIGSVAERVVRTAPCPVLTVRAVAPPSVEDATTHARTHAES